MEEVAVQRKGRGHRQEVRYEDRGGAYDSVNHDSRKGPLKCKF